MRKPTSHARRVLAVAVVASAIGLAACGDEDADPQGAASTGSTTTGDTGGAQTDAREPKASPDAETTPRAGTPDPAPDEDAAPAGAGPGDTGTARDAVAAAVESMYSDLAAGDAAGVCASMSGAARAQIAQTVPGGSTESPADRTCAASLEKFLRVAAESGTLTRTADASVKAVRIRGKAATATVLLNGQTGDIALTWEDGAWRFGPGAVAPTQ
jgi:hypothetical protein